MAHSTAPPFLCLLRCAGLTPEEAQEKPFIASMGIYVFKKNVLLDLLTQVGPSSLVRNLLRKWMHTYAAGFLCVHLMLFHSCLRNRNTIQMSAFKSIPDFPL